MNFLKKNIKLIILVIVLMIIVSGFSVYATTIYLATQVNYTRNNTTISVASALDELYSMKDNKYTEQQYQQYGSQQYSLGQQNAKEVTYNYGSGTSTASGVYSFDIKFNNPTEIWIFAKQSDGDNNWVIYRFVKSNDNFIADIFTTAGNKWSSITNASNASMSSTTFSMINSSYANSTYNWIAVK